jgi:predicted GIY-YIG superfamily endonuclease
MAQRLLFPDPRPLLERLGAAFFSQAPPRPGVYLMRDASDAVLYVGKAKNLRRRLASYRVANPDRMPPRHLRLLRQVQRIDLEECPDEPAALAREADLLRTLRPRFNRAGTWPGPARFLVWRAANAGLELGVMPAIEPDWEGHGPMGAGAFALHALLLRLLWCALNPASSITRMPLGWFRLNTSHHRSAGLSPGVSAALANLSTSTAPDPLSIPPPSQATLIPQLAPDSVALQTAATLLRHLCSGQFEPFADWLRARTASQTRPFELAARDADLDALLEFSRPR